MTEMFDEIEDLYMDGMSPKTIAECVGMPVADVLVFLEAADLLNQN